MYSVEYIIPKQNSTKFEKAILPLWEGRRCMGEICKIVHFEVLTTTDRNHFYVLLQDVPNETLINSAFAFNSTMTLLATLIN